MSLFFLLLAAVFITAQADDAGRYGNYSGTCSFRPWDTTKTKYITCMPNTARAFEFGDSFSFDGLSTGPAFAIELVSAYYESLFMVTVYPKEGRFTFWNAKHLEEHTYKVPQGQSAQFGNEPDGLTFYFDHKDAFTFRHKTAKPATDYKYLILHKSSASAPFDGAGYYSHLASMFAPPDVLKVTDNLWKKY